MPVMLTFQLNEFSAAAVCMTQMLRIFRGRAWCHDVFAAALYPFGGEDVPSAILYKCKLSPDTTIFCSAYMMALPDSSFLSCFSFP